MKRQTENEIDEQLRGMTYAYLELIDKGIRDICMPDRGVWDEAELEFIDEMAAGWGFCTCTVRHQRVGPDAEGKERVLEGVISFEKLIYAPKAHEKAVRLRELLERPFKAKDDIREIGRLFGYSKEKTEAFVRGDPDSTVARRIMAGAGKQARTDRASRKKTRTDRAR